MPKLKPTLNQADIQIITQVFQDQIETKVREVIKEELGNYPTKQEFYKREDEVMGELKAIRENQEILTQHDQDHTDRLDQLEILHKSPHPHSLNTT